MADTASIESASVSPLLHAQRAKEQQALSVHPKTVSRVVKRCEALTEDLVKVKVALKDITSPSSPVLPLPTLKAFSKLAGDFSPCLPFALLTARRHFLTRMHGDPSKAEVHGCRALVCEAVARWIIEELGREEGWTVLSARFALVENRGEDDEDEEGEETMPLSALETASDSQATFFLASPATQRCVFALYRGLLVQKNIEDGEPGHGIAGIRYELHRPSRTSSSFISAFDPLRIGVPRYQFLLRLALWILFLVFYSIGIQTPQRGLGPEDVVIYVMALGYVAEEAVRVRKIGLFPALTYWTCINLGIYALMAVAFVYRIADMMTHDIEASDRYRLLSFQYLSCASPLIWSKLVTIFDVSPFFGIMQIVVFRMLKSSAIFFALLTILAIGFTTALSGLDINPDHQVVVGVMHHLMQALLGSPQFEEYAEGTPSYPFGILLYYTWSTLTLVILLNILIALFGSAYSECTEDSVPTFLAFFSTKTLASIRAPDTFVYIAPFNLIEGVIAPFEYVVSKKTYTKINRAVMSVLFFLPLCAIALFESRFDRSRESDFEDLRSPSSTSNYSADDLDPVPYVHSPPPSRGSSVASVDSEGEGEEADEINRELGNGSANGSAGGKSKEGRISTVKYDDLRKELPSMKRDVNEEILEEIRALRKELKELKAARASGK